MATRADLDGWGRLAERHWLKHRPKAVAALQAEGRLYDALVEAQECAAGTYQRMIDQGTDWQVADAWVLNEYLILPDFED